MIHQYLICVYICKVIYLHLFQILFHYIYLFYLWLYILIHSGHTFLINVLRPRIPIMIIKSLESLNILFFVNLT
jgi:hypothetical protein